MEIAAVSGATGFIGRYLVDLLLRKNKQVYVLTRSASKVPAAWVRRVQVIETDIALSTITIPEDCEVFFHCAGTTKDPTLFNRVNVLGTKNVLKACEKVNSLKRFIHLSSTGVLGVSSKGYFDERTICRPQNGYEISKYEAEKVVKNTIAEFVYTILRPSIVFGARISYQSDSFFHLIKSFKSGKYRLLGDDRSFYHIVYVEDVAEALFRLGFSSEELVAGKEFILNDPLSWPEFSRIVTTLLGVDKPRKLSPWAAFPAAVLGSFLSGCGIAFPLTVKRYKALTTRAVISSEKIRSELAFDPEWGVEKGLEKTVSFYRNNNEFRF